MTQKVEDARVPQTDEDSLELAIQYLEAGNEEQVVPMLRRMADRGTADALELLAQCYASGTGAAWDLRKAERLLAKWARQGDGEAKLSLALRYKKGIDVPKSLHYADKWLKRAQRAGAPQGHGIRGGRGEGGAPLFLGGRRNPPSRPGAGRRGGGGGGVLVTKVKLRSA